MATSPSIDHRHALANAVPDRRLDAAALTKMGKGDKKQTFSSAKAAEALQSSGRGAGGSSGSAPAASGGFAFGAKYVGQVAAAVPGGRGAGGASSGSGEAASPGLARAAAIIPADLDGELSQQLQKLSKRDATTKLKALQALRALAKDRPAADLQAALPSWAYLYSRLILDNNRAVRAEASHACAALAAGVGRGIAPLLKSFVPAWWLAQSDGHGEAAAAARGAFAAAFPAAAKQREAVLFCRAEVLQLLADNLANKPQTLGDAKKESPEELQDRHERVLASSCAALGALLTLALDGGSADSSAGSSSGGGGEDAPGPQQAQQAECAPAQQEILDGVAGQLQQAAFYKAVLQSKAAAIRRQAYLLVALAAGRCPELLAPAVATAAPAVLGALGDRESSTHDALWGMLLSFARAFPGGWAHVNMQKAFLPRLWAFLRHACFGSAATSFPAVLPLVSLLPETTLGPRPAFFVSLLESIWQGLASLAPAGPAASQARQAAAAAYQDCLLFGLLKAEHLAAVDGGEASGAAEPAAAAGQEAAAGSAAGGQFAAELLEQSVGTAVLPAALGGSAAGPLGPELEPAEAEAILAGLAGKLGQPSTAAGSSSGGNGSRPQRLEQLLSVIGSGLAAALEGALGRSLQAQEEAAAAAPSAASSSSSEVFERTAAMVAALERSAGAGNKDVLGSAVGRPLMALLLPEVRGGSAPPAASSLLASLLKSFPQHAAADAAGPPAAAGAAASEAGGQQGGGAAAAASGDGQGAAAAATDELAALRLHQSASFTIDSMLRRLSEEGDPEAAAASCDLLLSCLPQVHAPMRKLGEVLQTVLQNGQAGTAVVLLEHLVSGQHPELAALAAGSPELDSVAAAALAGPSSGRAASSSSRGSGPCWLQPGDAHTSRLLALLLAGGQAGSLLAPAAQTAVLERLLEQLQAAVAVLAGGAGGSVACFGGREEPAAAAAPVLAVLRDALLAPALDASGAAEVRALRLRLLAASFALLLLEKAGEAEAEAAAAAAEDSGSEPEASTFHDESEVESVEIEVQPGAVTAAVRQLWEQHAAIAALLTAAPADQQAAFSASVQQAVAATLRAHPSLPATFAAADAATALVKALQGTALLRSLLQSLLLEPADAAAAGSSGAGSSSGSSGGRYSLPRAYLVAGLVATAGFEPLLSAGDAEVAVAVGDLLAALQGYHGGQMRQVWVLYLTGPPAAALLPLLLEAAAQAAAAGSESHAAVLCSLLQATDATRGYTAAAEFFAAAAVAEPAKLPLPLLNRVLPIVAPEFRSSPALLEQSRLAELSQRLCLLACQAEPVALAAPGDAQQAALDLLQAAAACFPCIPKAEAAGQLPAPATVRAPEGDQQGAAGPASFSRGDEVWYRQADGSWTAAEIVAVDVTVDPPSYAIRLGSSSGGSALRDTEADRLRLRLLGSSPPPSAQEEESAAAAAKAAATRKWGEVLMAMPPAGDRTAEEQATLLQLLQHQLRGARAATAAAAREGGDSPGAAADASAASAAAIAQLVHVSVVYCSLQLSQQQWSLVLSQTRDTFARCAGVLAAAAARVAAAVCAAAGEIAVGADMSSPAVALQFFRRLGLKGVLERSDKARAEAAKVAASLAAELAFLDAHLLPLLLPALQAHTRCAALAALNHTLLSQRDWQAAEASACSHTLQLFVTVGSLAAAAGVSGQEASAALAAWMEGRQASQAARNAADDPWALLQSKHAWWDGDAWALLSKHVAGALRGADRAFLLAAVDRANSAMDATGVDALGSLLALCLSGIPPQGMASAAFSAILQHPELTASLSAAEGVDEEALEEQQRQQGQAGGGGDSGGDAASLLEAVGVRPELAAAVAASGAAGAGFFNGWALLLAHLLSAPADSRGRRLLAQALKDAHALVPALLNSLVPLLPLDTAPSTAGSRRDSRGGSSSRGGTPAPAGGSAEGQAPEDASFSSRLAALGPFAAGPGSERYAEDAARSSLQRQAFAQLLYAAVLQALPASARLWYADLRDRGTAAAVERYTSAAVSGQLLAAELAAVTQAASAFGKFDKFSVRASAGSREVVAVMEVEDGHLLELAVRLPASMPLRPHDLECRRRVGVSEARLRKWLLSISAFLRMQNGSVAEAISLWKRNVDKEFEGQSECLICYSIIQPTSGQLPRLSCRTCRQRYHGTCLYRWFKESGKSNCPHCQSPW